MEPLSPRKGRLNAHRAISIDPSSFFKDLLSDSRDMAELRSIVLQSVHEGIDNGRIPSLLCSSLTSYSKNEIMEVCQQRCGVYNSCIWIDIFSYLSLPDLFRATRVCRDWDLFIRGSGLSIVMDSLTIRDFLKIQPSLVRTTLRTLNAWSIRMIECILPSYTSIEKCRSNIIPLILSSSLQVDSLSLRNVAAPSWDLSGAYFLRLHTLILHDVISARTIERARTPVLRALTAPPCVASNRLVAQAHATLETISFIPPPPIQTPSLGLPSPPAPPCLPPGLRRMTDLELEDSAALKKLSIFEDEGFSNLRRVSMMRVSLSEFASNSSNYTPPVNLLSAGFSSHLESSLFHQQSTPSFSRQNSQTTPQNYFDLIKHNLPAVFHPETEAIERFSTELLTGEPMLAHRVSTPLVNPFAAAATPDRNDIINANAGNLAHDNIMNHNNNIDNAQHQLHPPHPNLMDGELPFNAAMNNSLADSSTSVINFHTFLFEHLLAMRLSALNPPPSLLPPSSPVHDESTCPALIPLELSIDTLTIHSNGTTRHPSLVSSWASLFAHTLPHKDFSSFAPSSATNSQSCKRSATCSTATESTRPCTPLIELMHPLPAGPFVDAPLSVRVRTANVFAVSSIQVIYTLANLRGVSGTCLQTLSLSPPEPWRIPGIQVIDLLKSVHRSSHACHAACQCLSCGATAGEAGIGSADVRERMHLNSNPFHATPLQALPILSPHVPSVSSNSSSSLRSSSNSSSSMSPLLSPPALPSSPSPFELHNFYLERIVPDLHLFFLERRHHQQHWRSHPSLIPRPVGPTRLFRRNAVIASNFHLSSSPQSRLQPLLGDADGNDDNIDSSTDSSPSFFIFRGGNDDDEEESEEIENDADLSPLPSLRKTSNAATANDNNNNSIRQSSPAKIAPSFIDARLPASSLPHPHLFPSASSSPPATPKRLPHNCLVPPPPVITLPVVSRLVLNACSVSSSVSLVPILFALPSLRELCLAAPEPSPGTIANIFSLFTRPPPHVSVPAPTAGANTYSGTASTTNASAELSALNFIQNLPPGPLLTSSEYLPPDLMHSSIASPVAHTIRRSPLALPASFSHYSAENLTVLSIEFAVSPSAFPMFKVCHALQHYWASCFIFENAFPLLVNVQTLKVTGCLSARLVQAASVCLPSLRTIEIHDWLGSVAQGSPLDDLRRVIEDYLPKEVRFSIVGMLKRNFSPRTLGVLQGGGHKVIWAGLENSD